VNITFDPAKDVGNQTKHGISLALAARFEWPNMMAGIDDRTDYRELREIGFGVIDERLYCVVFTQRGDTMHIISLRKANKREVRNYVEQA
jgi:uncharacterized DUF497 family protein